VNGKPISEKFDSHKNELVEQEQIILNAIGFDLDSYPLFYDISEIFMAMGTVFTTDMIESNG
jgi:hypothetical protein